MEAYSKFDFDGNNEFQLYLSNIFPTPTNVEKYKRNWYKKSIDPNFDVNDKQQSQKQEQNTKQEEQQNQQQQQQEQQQEQQYQQQQQQQYQQQQQKFQRQQPQLPILFVIEGVLKVLYFPALLFLQKPELHKYVNLGSVIICLMALKRIKGFPKKGQYQEYFATSLKNEFATNIFYMISLFAIDNIVFQLPIALHFLVGAAELWTQLGQDEGFTLRFAQYIVRNRKEILITKQKIEIYLFFYSVIGVFIRKTSLFLGVFIFQNILLKTKCNEKMMEAQSSIRDWYKNNLLENKRVPQSLQKLLALVWKGYEKLITIF